MSIKNEVNRLGNIMQDMESAYEYYAKQVGINNTIMYLLQIVYDNEPCTQKQICDIMRLPKQTVNTVVKDYQKKGIFEAVELREDRRHKHIRLTAEGRQYCERILPPIAEAEAYALEQFSVEERNTLFSLMEKYNKSFTKKLL